MKWKMLMVQWMKTESLFVSDSYNLPKSRWTLRKRILIMATAYFSLAFIEHGFYLVSEITQLNIEIRECNQTDIIFAELYVKKHYKFILDRIPFQYNHFLGFLLQYLNFAYTFYWNFVDIFIILISLGIGILYDKINWRLEGFKRLLVNETLWAETRYNHVQVSELIEIVNKSINELVIVACFSDGYFILSQALNITT
jgi:gustatory receptor